MIEKLDIRIGDEIYVEKGGEIIPKIVGVNLQSRDENSKKLEYISNCPECNTLLVKEEGEAGHYCPNYNHCPPQILGRFQHFISKKALYLIKKKRIYCFLNGKFPLFSFNSPFFAISF